MKNYRLFVAITIVVALLLLLGTYLVFERIEEKQDKTGLEQQSK